MIAEGESRRNGNARHVAFHAFALGSDLTRHAWRFLIRRVAVQALLISIRRVVIQRRMGIVTGRASQAAVRLPKACGLHNADRLEARQQGIVGVGKALDRIGDAMALPAKLNFLEGAGAPGTELNREVRGA